MATHKEYSIALSLFEPATGEVERQKCTQRDERHDGQEGHTKIRRVLELHQYTHQVLESEDGENVDDDILASGTGFVRCHQDVSKVITARNPQCL